MDEIQEFLGRKTDKKKTTIICNNSILMSKYGHSNFPISPTLSFYKMAIPGGQVFYLK